MKKALCVILALTLILCAFVACSHSDKNSSNTDNTAVLQVILENFKADEQYAEYKAMYPNTSFEEKIEGNSIVVNISGDEGVNGNYAFRLDGDYLTYTQEANSEDYVGYSFFMYLKSATDKYLGMDSNLTTGYIAGCEYFGIENNYFVRESDEAGTTTQKLYIAGKWDMKELEIMYVNDKALENTDVLNESDISGAVNCGKIRVLYYGNKNSVDIIVSEYGKRGDLTYQSVMNTVAKLLPDEFSVFAKYYTKLDESDGDGFKVTFGLDDALKEAHSIEVVDGAEYTVVHFGA